MPPSPSEEDFEENARKRPNDGEQPQNQAGPPVKKARLSNGYENGFESSAMDVDEEQNGDENAYPSPEQLPSPVVATVGAEQGTQVEKVNELSAETTFLELSDDPLLKSTVLLQCEFNPRDPAILAAAGTDALARMWVLSGIMPDAGPDSPEKPVLTPHRHLLDESTLPSTTATGLSWASDGSHVAVSSEPIEDGDAKVEFWTTDATRLASFNCFESPVICLRWNLTNTACLALSPQKEGEGTLITVMNPSMATCVHHSIPNHILLNSPLDAAWTSNEEFVLCGGDMLQKYQLTEGTISPTKKYEVRENHALSKVTFDWRSRLLATASDSGTIDV